MGLLDKLKSLFGSDQSAGSPARGTEADVTVEHEPAAESEHAVKGTDTGRQQRDTAQPQDDQHHSDAHAAESQAGAGATPEQTDETDAEESTSMPDETSETTIEDADTADVDTADADTADEDTAESDNQEPSSEAAPADSPSIEEIKGIGPTYAERLGAAGIETVADIAAADPADVAEAAETGENRAGDWVERAQDF
jgi:predicted flap endonuclease-1-like 5' DNA nuclease